MVNNSETSANKTHDTSVVDTSVVDTTNYTDQNFLQIADLYVESLENRVAFDKKYDKKTIEFDGTITSISNDYGCAKITFSILNDENENMGDVECTNCRADVDRWSDQIAKLKLQDYVRVKGIYSASSSSKYSLNFYSCKIVK